MSMITITRRTKWHPTPPPPPSPKILNLPRSRRTRQKQPKTITKNYPFGLHQKYYTYKGKLESLFDQENDLEPPIVLLNSNLNSISSPSAERRERVEEKEQCGGGGGFEEEKWRFQAEILRAECNFLRMEREFALKKLERNRVKMERTLRSAVQTLVSVSFFFLFFSIFPLHFLMVYIVFDIQYWTRLNDTVLSCPKVVSFIAFPLFLALFFFSFLFFQEATGESI